MTTLTTLTIVTQNLGLGGLWTGGGDPEDRWPLLRERILSAGPADLVVLCEALDWDRWGHRQLARAMADLDMEALPLPPSSSGIRPALLYRQASMGRWTGWNTDFAQETVHGFGVACFDVGLPAPLAVVATHLTPFDPSRARSEAQMVATRAMRYGPYAVVSGDINYPPASPDHPAPDYAQMRPYNRAARTRLPSEVDGRVVPERRVTQMLAHSGYVDVAWELHQRTGDHDLLAPTGTDDRIDQTWVSRPLAPAVADYRLLTDPAGASDHAGTVVVLDLDQAVTDDVWTYR